MLPAESSPSSRPPLSRNLPAPSSIPGRSRDDGRSFSAISAVVSFLGNEPEWLFNSGNRKQSAVLIADPDSTRTHGPVHGPAHEFFIAPGNIAAVRQRCGATMSFACPESVRPRSEQPLRGKNPHSKAHYAFVLPMARINHPLADRPALRYPQQHRGTGCLYGACN